MAKTPLYTGLSVSVIRDEDQGLYLFGVVTEGAWVTFASRKLGGVDSDIESARLAAAEQRQSVPSDTATSPQPPQSATPGTTQPTGL